MKDIKFRAWHRGIPKRFRYSGTPAQMFYDEYPGECLLFLHQGQDIEAVMQYTGLKDKNGKEIYEGDILTETVNQCRWIYEVRTVKEYGNNLYKVTRYRNFKHDDDGEQIFGDFWLNEGWSQITGRYEEVIGNIYENPELLTHENTSTPK